MFPLKGIRDLLPLPRTRTERLYPVYKSRKEQKAGREGNVPSSSFQFSYPYLSL